MKMEIHIVRETDFGNIDSVWFSKELASKKKDECNNLWRSRGKAVRPANWIVETWEAEDEHPR